MAKPKAVKRLYKMIGVCRHCKERFVVDLEHRYSSRNYCKKCTDKFRQWSKNKKD